MTPVRCYHRVRIAARAIALSVVAVLALLTGADLPAIAQDTAPEDGLTTWLVDLIPDGDDTNVRADAGGLRLDSNTAGPASNPATHKHGQLLTVAYPLP